MEHKQVNTHYLNDFDLINGAALAYIGDAVYELFVRRYVIQLGKTHPNRLHQAAIKYVSAKAQARVILHWLDQSDFLTPSEIQFYKRGRNYKANTKAKNASIAEYRQATGFEALLGWLQLTGQEERCQVLMETAVEYLNHEGGSQ